MYMYVIIEMEKNETKNGKIVTTLYTRNLQKMNVRHYTADIA